MPQTGRARRELVGLTVGGAMGLLRAGNEKILIKLFQEIYRNIAKMTIINASEITFGEKDKDGYVPTRCTNQSARQ